MQRHLHYNKNAEGYTWKRLGKELDMNKTLEENGIVDQNDEFQKLGVGVEEPAFYPSLHIYFNNDIQYQN